MVHFALLNAPYVRAKRCSFGVGGNRGGRAVSNRRCTEATTRSKTWQGVCDCSIVVIGTPMGDQMRYALLAIVSSSVIAGCASTTVTPISRNEIILTTSAAPVCGTSGAQQIVGKMAAVETLRRGFDRYLIGGIHSRNNSRATVMPPTGSYTTAQVSTYGSTAYGSATTTNYGGGVMYSGTHDASLQVLMLNSGDEGYENGVDARSVLGPDWEALVKDGIKSC